MAVRQYFGTKPGVSAESVDTVALGQSGSWSVPGVPLTISWDFSFTENFFDGKVALFGMTLLSVDLSADGKETISASAFGWDVEGDIVFDLAHKQITAELTVTEGGVQKVDDKFVLFTWAK
jgi:hypothetical protein